MYPFVVNPFQEFKRTTELDHERAKLLPCWGESFGVLPSGYNQDLLILRVDQCLQPSLRFPCRVEAAEEIPCKVEASYLSDLSPGVQVMIHILRAL